LPYDWRTHQIWHGESELLIPDAIQDGMVDCVITDPPFGSDNQSNQSRKAESKEMARKIANDSSPEEAIATFTRVFDVLMPKLKQDAPIYLFSSYQVLEFWLPFTSAYFKNTGWDRKAIITWDKQYPGMGDTNCPWGTGQEFILYFEGPVAREKRTHRQNAVISMARLPSGKLIHPHEKPEPLLCKLAEASTERGDFLIDPFGGSGSLVRGMQSIDRSAIAIECDEFNYKQAMQKWKDSGAALF